MNRHLDRIMLGAIAVMAAALVWVVSGTLEPRIVKAGDLAPDFRIVTDSGKTVTRADFGGKLLVLNFWASWCPPCVEETPSLNAFQKQLAPDGVVVLGVSIDANEKLYHQFVDRYKIAFPTARDPDANISASYGTFQIPESYIIDRTGRVREKIISSTNWMDPDFLARVKSLL
ncbi:MAG TPA: TlpA disulfide reductase family protein [Bryobacteraceae bacterium]|nr:TlpA disulfide reductase family protein [Bryobacteraceae bacterium]